VWDSIRSLHVAESEVEEAIARALDGQPLGRLVDVGTGTGRMIELFGRGALQSVGIDRSSEMLRLARVKLEAAGKSRPSLRQGGHVRAPARRLQRRHDHHPPGSALTPTLPRRRSRRRRACSRQTDACSSVDFAAHEREELRATDAHIRLGFDD
jgi:ArsR family transcriptional regulator